MLKQMAEREAREALDSQRRRDIDIKSKNDAGQALRLQMLEKQAQKELERKNDELYASQAANRINYMDNLDR